jgi:quercetin dioxygenase-like cupin family protein
MTDPFAYFEDLAALVPDIPSDSILSRTIYDDDQVRAVLFGFAPGQELSEHTSTYTALLHFVRGEATVTLGDETRDAVAGTFVRMAPHLPHSIQARTPVVMLLVMLKAQP